MSNNMSPVQQDFVWLAEYADATHLAEFDFNTQEENNFYSIDRKKLIRFGLVGHGNHMYYELYGGFFKILGSMIEVVYDVDGKEYYLTGQPKLYNDIITYKDAESVFNPLQRDGKVRNSINQFNFGYKETLNIEDTTFNYKAICQVPFGEPMKIHFWLVADKNLDGKIVIKKNGRVVDEFYAPLKEGIGGELVWQMK